MIGTFLEQSTDAHMALRQEVLRRKTWFPTPPWLQTHACSADDVAASSAIAAAALDALGAAFLQFDRELSNAELIALAATLGDPLTQPNPRTQPWVDDGVILNLRAEQDETDDQEWGLLFAENYVMLHTELAAKPVAGQPRYVLLCCVEAPQFDDGGQTLLVSMEEVVSRLSRREAGILQRTWPARNPGAPPFLRFEGQRAVFSFKDAEGEQTAWIFDGADDMRVTVGDVNAAIQALLRALYEPAGVMGFHWQPHALAVFDNMRCFHGRTFGQRPTNGRPPRHLRRVRVTSGMKHTEWAAPTPNIKQEVLS